MNAFDDGNNNDDNNNNNNNNNRNKNNPHDNEQQRARKGKGRQKITMEKIQNDTNLQVTFSKRRAGVFKKASELSTLCGAQSAVVVFSPGNKPHSFGHPNVEAVASRFLRASGNDLPPRTNADQLIRAHGDAAMQQRNQELIETEAELERERRRKTELSNQRLPQQQLEALDYQQLEQLKHSLMGFKQDLETKTNNTAPVPNPNYAPQMGNPNVVLPAPPIVGGSSSAVPFDSGLGLGSMGNYGYMMQYPPFGPGGSSSGLPGNYGVDPSAVVPFDGGLGMSGIGGSQGAQDDDDDEEEEDDDDLFQGFGGNYPGPGQY